MESAIDVQVNSFLMNQKRLAAFTIFLIVKSNNQMMEMYVRNAIQVIQSTEKENV